jgi:Rieske Fe-S protein
MMETNAVARRAVLAGGCGAACVLALSACAEYGPGGPVTAPAPGPNPTAAPAPNAARNAAPNASPNAAPTATPAAAAPAPGALASTADVPVGGGVVIAAQGLVVTQPTAGTFKAFSATCTHQGCVVNQVKGGTINCPCHGSRFAVADGSPVAGPAKRPLAEAAVTVQGTSVVLG